LHSAYQQLFFGQAANLLNMSLGEKQMHSLPDWCICLWLAIAGAWVALGVFNCMLISAQAQKIKELENKNDNSK
jgi:hypothetical protein